MTKILAIGDPHGDIEKFRDVPREGIDLILITGDLGKADLARKMFFENINKKMKGLPEKKYSNVQEKKAYMESYTSTIKLINYLSEIAPVYTIWGNVESSDREVKKISRKIKIKLPFLNKELAKNKNVKIINDKLIDFNGLKIAGLQYFIDVCWVEEFKPTDYKKRLKIAKEQTEKAKKIINKFGKVDILLCHQPPYGILDAVNSPLAPKGWNGKSAGSKVILNYVNEKHPKLVLCGHMHESKGVQNLGNTKVYNLGVASYTVINI